MELAGDCLVVVLLAKRGQEHVCGIGLQRSYMDWWFIVYKLPLLLLGLIRVQLVKFPLKLRPAASGNN